MLVGGGEGVPEELKVLHSYVGPRARKLNFLCCCESVCILQVYAVWENLDCALFYRIIFSELG